MDKKNLLTKRVKSTVYGLSSVVIMLIVFAIFAVLNMFQGISFLSPSNLSTILNQASFLVIVGIAHAIVILMGGINLSIGSVMALTTVMWGDMLLKTSEVNPLIPAAMVILTAAAIGYISGLLITKLRITPYIATFAVMYACRGLAWVYLRNRVIYGVNQAFRDLLVGRLFRVAGFNVTMPMLIALIALLAFFLILRGTTLGRKWYFTGANPTAARISGINTDRMINIAYTVSSALAGFAGLMYMARLNSTEPGLAGDTHFEAITVSLIGGFAMAGGYGNIWGVAGGAIVVYTIQSGMNMLRLPGELQALINGVLIIFAVYLNQTLSKKKMEIDNDLSDARMAQRQHSMLKEGASR